MKYQVIIIGGGPAGYTAAEAAAKGGLSVLLIEKNSLGGVCLNEGCIPTKTLLYSAKTYDSAKHASKYAVNIPEVSFDLPKIIARKSKVVRKLVLGVKAKLTANNVTIVSGEAQIIDKKYGSLRGRDLRRRESDIMYGFGNLYSSYSGSGRGELLDAQGCFGQ